MVSLKGFTLPSRSVRARTHGVPIKPASRMSMLILGNDNWDVFEGIPKHYSLRTRLRMKLKYSSFGICWEMFQTFFALLVSVLYVLETYQPDRNSTNFDIAAVSVFTVDYLLNFYCCENRFYFVISPMSILDAVTILPAVLDYASGHHDSSSNPASSSSSSFPFLRFIRVLRLLRLTRLIRTAGTRSISAVQKQIHTIVLLITCIIFISAGIFHATESANLPEGGIPITFGDALYFLLVTMSTVGYGDIAPQTTYGKVIAAAVIIVSFTIIPAELTRLTQLMALQSPFRKFYEPSIGNPHILVVGHISDPHTLLDFFRELYHPDRELVDHADETTAATSSRSREPPCVLLAPHEPSEAIVTLLDHPILQNRVTYIKGSVMSEEDLCRVGADAAGACFVLVDKSTANARRVDADTVLRLLAIRNYNAQLEIYTQIVSPMYSDYINEVDADHVLCLDEIKLSVLAKSCLYPGLVTLISNLFRSSAMPPKSTVPTDKCHEEGGPRKPWEKEYAEGLALEVYATRLPAAFFGLTFTQACGLLYQSYGGEVILLGVYEPKRVGRPHPSCFTPPASPGTTSGKAKVSKAPAVVTPQPPSQGISPGGGSPLPTASVPSARMFTNPGATLRMMAGQIVYVLSESKKLTHSICIAQHVEAWVSKGNRIPLSLPLLPSERGIRTEAVVLPPLRTSPNSSPQPPHPHSPRHRSLPRRHSQRVVLIENASVSIPANSTDSSLPLSGMEPSYRLENHIIVVSNLNPVAIHAFLRLLRVSHYSKGSKDYHAVLFLSWASASDAAPVCHLLQGYDDVFVMLAHDDSKTELLRANILQAARCIVLSDKAAIAQLDGETIDSSTIFHYLAILSIQSEYGVDTTNGIMPIVELTVPGTMKILDTALQKRTLRSFLHRQKLDDAALRAQLREEIDGGNGDEDVSGEKATTTALDNQIDKVKIRGRQFKYQRSTSIKRVNQLVQQGKHDLLRFESSMQMRKRMRQRHSSLKVKQDGRATTAQRRSPIFDTNSATNLVPFFAAGFAFADDVFDNMLCQSYFTPGLLRFIDALLFTENGRMPRRLATVPSRAVSTATTEDTSKDLCQESDDDFDFDIDECDPVGGSGGVIASSLIQIALPPEFVGESFGDLFLALLRDEHTVAIGLFRGNGESFTLPYVATGPTMDTILVHDDLVFVLAPPEAQARLRPQHIPEAPSLPEQHDHQAHFPPPPILTPPKFPRALKPVNNRSGNDDIINTSNRDGEGGGDANTN